MFADDLLLFSEASLDQMQIMKCLDSFCKASRQKVNCEKTKILFSKNVRAKVVDNICKANGFDRTQNFGKYLKIHLISSGSTHRHFIELINKVKQRLTGWKTKALSMASRITLASSIIATLPIYIM